MACFAIGFIVTWAEIGSWMVEAGAHDQRRQRAGFDMWLRRKVLPSVRRPVRYVQPQSSSVPARFPPSGFGALAAVNLTARDGKVFASSREVARMFDKEHRNVLRDIDALLAAGVPPLSFEQGSYTLPATGAQSHRMYEMSRDGFTLLAMGFNGANALKFKLAYIAEFNRMEEALRSAPPPVLVEASDLVQKDDFGRWLLATFGGDEKAGGPALSALAAAAAPATNAVVSHAMFKFDGAPVRVVTRDGEPWFVLADVCKVLDISHAPSAA